MNNWSQNDIELAKFTAGVRARLIEMGELAAADYDGSTEPVEAVVAMEDFSNESAALSAFSSAADAVAAFRDWYQGVGFVMPNRATFSFSQTFNVQSGTVTFGLSATFDAAKKPARAAAYKYLRTQVVGAYRDWLNSQDRNAGPNAPKIIGMVVSDRQPTDRPAMPAGATETLRFSEVEKGAYAGKDTVRLCGGRWSKFGVALYKEVYERAGMADFISRLDYGRFAIGGEMIIELKSDGKPYRVVSVNLDKPF